MKTENYLITVYLEETKTSYIITDKAKIIIEKDGEKREIDTDEAHKDFAKILLKQLSTKKQEFATMASRHEYKSKLLKSLNDGILEKDFENTFDNIFNF